MTGRQVAALVQSYRLGTLTAAELWRKLGVYSLAVFTAQSIPLPYPSVTFCKVHSCGRIRRDGYTADGVYWGAYPGMARSVYAIECSDIDGGRVWTYHIRANSIRQARRIVRRDWPLAVVD